MIYPHKFLRNPFTKTAQERIRRTTFAIVGLGGTGGFILENLLRAGAENFILFEHDRFELSNFNRQILATEDTLDKLKLEAAASRAKAINSSASLELAGRFDIGSGLGAAKILIDGSDNVGTKLAMARAARRKRIPFVFCSANSSRGIVTVFRRYRFERAFQIDEKLDYRLCSSVQCPAASIAGTLAASQAINVILRKRHVKAPQAIFFDLEGKEMFWRAELG